LSPIEPSAEATSLRVELGPSSYDIRVVDGAIEGFGSFARAVLASSWSGSSCRRGLIVTDRNIQELAAPYREALDSGDIRCQVAVVPAGESSKSLEQASALYDTLVENKADRHFLIVAFGGGVVGDLAGFVAATFARGLPLLMVPTTLLAQVDSSVGGKVAVNHPRAKNIIGAFHQPIGVWVDSSTLRTLPARELRCGLAEVVKYGVILDGKFFDWLEERVEEILALDPDAIRRVVARSCQLKAVVVSQDEREETGLRAVLNLGHTIGHAVEAVSGYGGRYLHGEAVAVGMVAECRLAERLGWITRGSTERVASLLGRFGLPTEAPGLDADALIEAMTRDKKNRGGKVRFVLPRGIGKVELTDAPSDEDVRAVLAGAGS
jgi:3-dehydroquinate synthase